MLQLAKRIANGHAHQQGVPEAVGLAACSKDLNTKRHADNARTYHAKYGHLYDRRDQTPTQLPMVVVTWLLTLRQEAKQPAQASQVRPR